MPTPTDRRDFLAGVLGLPVAALFAGAVPAAQAQFRIGMSHSLIFGQVEPRGAEALAQTLSGLFTIPGKPQARFRLGRAADLAKQAANGELELCILAGIEYGWLRGEHHRLKTAATAFTTGVRLGACLLAPTGGPARGVADLRGKVITLPRWCIAMGRWSGVCADGCYEMMLTRKMHFRQPLSCLLARHRASADRTPWRAGCIAWL